MILRMANAYIYIGKDRERRGTVGHMVGEHLYNERKFFIEDYDAMRAFEEDRREWAELNEEEYAEFERIIDGDGLDPYFCHDTEALADWCKRTVAKKRWLQRRNRLQQKEEI